MGIRGIETAMKNTPNCIRRVRLSDLIAKDTDNVIVVDGNQFYRWYIRRLFDSVRVGLKTLEMEIQIFVDSFRGLGVHMIFVFKHKLPQDAEKRQNWIARRQVNVQSNDEILRLLNMNEDIAELKSHMVHVKYFVIQILRSMNCEVHCELNIKGTKLMVDYAVRRNAVGVLSQNSYLVFYDRLPRYLSIKELDLNEMETDEYNIDPLAEYLQLDRQLFPLFATIVGENDLVHTNHPYQLARDNIRQNICKYMRGPNYLVTVARFIRKNLRQSDEVHFLKRMFGSDGETLIPALKKYQSQFMTSPTEHEDDTSFPMNQLAASCNVETSAKIEEMVRRGEMYAKIHHILVYNIYEQYIIPEDYETLPSSGLVFRCLRKKLYGILFRCTSNSEKIKVEEWYVEEGKVKSCQESPDLINEEVHPGLLTLWENNSVEIIEKKWILFGSAISPSLDIDLLKQLPPNLIVPTSVLFYLCDEMSRCSPSSNYNLLETWEVEVFIAEFLLYPSMNIKVSQLQGEEKPCARSVMLCAFFVSGCFYINMLHQVCGLPLALTDVNIFSYFDGFLFHYLYKVVEKQGVGHLITSDLREDFLKIKKILNLN